MGALTKYPTVRLPLIVLVEPDLNLLDKGYWKERAWKSEMRREQEG